MQPALERFVESWGALGALWGINRSTARVHALLLASDEPVHLDHIAERLSISRSNASMSLKELSGWGLVQRSTAPGDRRDFFAPERDAWLMCFKIVKERKKREYDPALAAVRAALFAADGVLGAKARARLGEIEQLLATVDRILEPVLTDPDKGRHLFGFFAEFLRR
jgi:HTH-type transcriptional regulator, glycine betaine synthesis regulator